MLCVCFVSMLSLKKTNIQCQVHSATTILYTTILYTGPQKLPVLILKIELYIYNIYIYRTQSTDEIERFTQTSVRTHSSV